MMISTRGRYALRLMLDLANHQGSGYVSLKEISERQQISKKYLEQIIPVLNRLDLLMTVRGFQGGYRLSREPREYTLGEILRATEGSLAPVACLATEKNLCSRQADCATLPVWTKLDQIICDYLDSVTLQDLLDQQAERSNNSYVI